MPPSEPDQFAHCHGMSLCDARSVLGIAVISYISSFWTLSWIAACCTCEEAAHFNRNSLGTATCRDSELSVQSQKL